VARDWRETVRRLAARAADERTAYPERVASALKACELIARERLLDDEQSREHHDYVIRRVEGPFYLRKEDERSMSFIYWRHEFVKRGIEEGAHAELVLPREAVENVMWLSDEEKWRRLGCCPGNGVAAWVDVRTSPP